MKHASLPLKALVAVDDADVDMELVALEVAVVVAVEVIGRVVTVEVAVEVADEVAVVVWVENPHPA